MLGFLSVPRNAGRLQISAIAQTRMIISTHLLDDRRRIGERRLLLRHAVAFRTSRRPLPHGQPEWYWCASLPWFGIRTWRKRLASFRDDVDPGVREGRAASFAAAFDIPVANLPPHEGGRVRALSGLLLPGLYWTAIKSSCPSNCNV